MKGTAMAKKIDIRRTTFAAALMVGLVAAAVPSHAQLSGSSSSSTGSSCTGNDADGFCGFSTQVQINNSTQFRSRYAWNVNADIGIFSTRDMSGTARHNLSFTATAPGGYRLDIATSRVGNIGRSSDAAGCDGSADTSGVTGNTNIALSSGSLGLADPGGIGNGGGNANVGINQSGSATIFRVSNAVGQSHSLSFTWTGSARSNSCEASVRQGQQNGSTTGCADTCDYPGNPSRTLANDGHFVTVTYTSLCGNGTIDGSVSEQCDLGSANGAFGTCCSTSCQFRSNSTTCRNSAGVCDPAENCTGSSATCPADILSGTSTVCRAAAGECDLAENCTGSGAACPGDTKKSNGTACTSDGNPCTLDQCNGSAVTCQHPAGNFGAVCRAAAGVCDVQETCNGSSPTCPADAKRATSFVCRAAAGICDQAETCDGTTNNCPADAKKPSGTACSLQAGLCDIVEVCDGSSNTCPPDGFQPNGFTCRAAVGVCDVAETCSGSSPSCPADAKSTAVCRPSAGVCDLAESCDGSSNNCPADSVAGAFVTCRPSAGVCDLPETCSGSGVNCPPDAKSTAVCRAAAGVCDLAESCNGSSNTCPADQKSTAVCRPAAGACDAPESCNGSSNTCPADGFAPSSQVCRPTAGVCDVAENCTGLSGACPPDLLALPSTVCRAATGVCDVAETCSGVGAACPADNVLPDNTPCSDGSTCTTNDVCSNGECTGTPTLDTCLDDFTCYKAKNSSGQPKFVAQSVHLVDAFEDQTFLVRKMKHLCPPADKHDGNGVVDAATHLESYQIKSITGTHQRRFNLLIQNQLGDLRVDTVRPDLLLVPTAKDLLSPPGPPSTSSAVDHYKCYKIKVTSGTPRFPKGTTVQESDQFRTQAALSLRKPKHLCVPVDKNDEGVNNPSTHLLCYTAKSATKVPKKVGIFVNNQLTTAGKVDAIKPGEFCIPSTRTGSPSGAFLDAPGVF